MSSYLDKLDKSWLALDDVIVYGLGRTGEKLVGHLLDYLKLRIKFIIDNNPDVIARGEYCGIEIRSLQQMDDYILKNHKIVVLTGAMAYESIAKSLAEKGLKENFDYCSIEQFVPEYSWKKFQKVVLCQVGTSITTACTLKCRDCCMFTARVKCYKTYDFDELKQDADAFFRVVNKVLCYQILGGEAFLHKNLAEYIEYLGERYGEQIGHIQILTNGTIIPDARTLKVCQKYDIYIRISDYSLQVSYSDVLKKLEETLKEWKIKFSVLKQMKWSDIGFPDRQKIWGEDDESIHQHMITCSRDCQQLNDGRYYFCGTFWGAVKGKLCNQEVGEFIELNDIDLDDEEQRKMVLEYSLGNIPGKGYMSLCKVCNGFGNDNTALLDAGIQHAQ